jgi:hypothetical protein
MSRASETRSAIDSATSSAKAQRPAEDAGVAGVRAATRDPFAEASSLLVHLVINKTPAIRHFLDKVTVDEAAATALAQQWSDQFPAALREQRDALVSARESIAQNWEGEGASRTYQDRQRELEDLADSLAAACEGAGFLTSGVNELMVGVREQIIEWIAQLVSMLMKRLIVVAATFPLPIVGQIAEAEFIFEAIGRVGETIARITSLISRVEGILGEVSSVAQVLGGATQQVQQLGSALGEVPQGSGASPLRALGRVGSVRQGGPTGSHGPVIRAAVPSRSKSGGGSTHAQGAGTGTRGLGPQTGATPSSSSGTHPQGGGVNAGTSSRGLGGGTKRPAGSSGQGPNKQPKVSSGPAPSLPSRGPKPGQGVDTGTGRDRYGYFISKQPGSNQPGKNAEQEGIDDYKDANPNAWVTDEQRKATLQSPPAVVPIRGGKTEPFKNDRRYDAIAKHPNGEYTGVEVKSGSASRTANQRVFDQAVGPNNPASVTITNQQGHQETVNITSVELVNVPTEGSSNSAKRVRQ